MENRKHLHKRDGLLSLRPLRLVMIVVLWFRDGGQRVFKWDRKGFVICSKRRSGVTEWNGAEGMRVWESLESECTNGGWRKEGVCRGIVGGY